MATFSFYIVETPMRRSKMARQMPNPAIIAVGFCVIAISWWGASAMNARAGKISLSQVSADADLWYPDRGPATPDSPGCRADPQTIIQDGVESERDIDNLQCREQAENSLHAIHQRIQPGDVLFLASLRLPRFSDQWAYFAQSASSQIPAQGYQFNQPGVPDFLESFSGLSHAEDWGRWSDGNSAPAVVLSFIQPLPKGFTLQIISKGYGPNIGHQARVIVDNEEQRLNLGEQATEDALHFANHAGAKRIEIIPPSPQSPKDAGESTDGRKLGIGLLSIKIIAD
ncbi:unnamed protein product [Cylicostephanus goldi]|uniref:DUF7024 domain-containing protein n=1 Tax=Cylicostephanus goldi TaxID=71465 RepID=A0A3P7MQH9_CYLGO|nr:unnamed protein product [Cylicostephanus goldi]